MTANGKQSVSVIVGLCLIVAFVAGGTVINWIIDSFVSDSGVNFILDIVVAVCVLLMIARLYVVSINWRGIAAFLALLLALVAVIVGYYLGLIGTNLLVLLTGG